MIARNPSEIDIDDTPHQLRSHAGAVIYDKHRLLVHLLEVIQRQAYGKVWVAYRRRPEVDKKNDYYSE